METLAIEAGFPKVCLDLSEQIMIDNCKEYIEYFTVEQEGDYFINITNGDNLNKDTAISSAEISIEGIGQIFGLLILIRMYFN